MSLVAQIGQYSWCITVVSVIDACMGVIEALHTSFQRYHPPKKDRTFMQRLKIWFQTVDDWHNDLK